MDKPMKIGNSHDGIASPPKAERSAARPPEVAVKGANESVQPSVKAVSPPPSAKVAISSAAQAAASSAATEVSFDSAKVGRISQAISEGKFTVNANAIADKLVANAQELLKARANKH